MLWGEPWEERSGKFCLVRVDIQGWTRDWRRAEVGMSGQGNYKVKTYFLDDGLMLTMTPLFEKATKTKEIEDGREES